MLSNYLLFSGIQRTSLGGWKDFVGVFPTIEACQKVIDLELGMHDWWQVVDANTFDLISEGGDRV